MTITAPHGQCDAVPGGSAAQLIAGLASPQTGAVAAYSWSYVGTGMDASVTVLVPPSAAPGAYNVFLACQTGAESYAFAPATFTVTPSGAASPPVAPARPVATPGSGPAGTFVTIAAPEDECDPPVGGVMSSQIIAGVALPRTGETVAFSWAYPGPSAEPTVRVRIPPYTAPGTYNVFLACLSDQDSYAFAPSTFTVTA